MSIPVNLIDIQSGFLTASAHNANNSLLEQALEKALNREGGVGNAMQAVLDMGDNQVINVADATSLSSAVTLSQMNAKFLPVEEALDDLDQAVEDAQQAATTALSAKNAAQGAQGQAQAAAIAAGISAQEAADSAAEAIEAGELVLDEHLAAANPHPQYQLEEAGKGLSTEDYTTVEKNKLAGIEAGAEVNPDASEVKTLYESNLDTNAYTNAEKTKLSGIQTEATKNSTDAQLRNRSTHTGTQPLSTISGAGTAAAADVEDFDAAGSATAAQAFAVQRANHTGTQAASTISNFNSAASAAAPVQSVDGQTGAVDLSTNYDSLGSALSAVTSHETTYDHAGYDSHVASTSNPHSVTATQVGADPVGTAQSLLDDYKATQALLKSLDETSTLKLDFINYDYRLYEEVVGKSAKPFGDVLDFTRATVKNVYSPTGKLIEVPINTPAYQYDPETGEPQGLLIEEQRTNLLLWSEDLTSAAWSKFDESLWEFSVSTKPSPIDGVNFSRFFVPQDVIGANSLHYQFLSTTVGTDYVFGFIVAKDYNLLRYCKIDGMAVTRSIFDIATGTFVSIHSQHTAGVIDLGDSWMVWVSFTATDTSARAGVMPQEPTNIGYSADFTAGGYQYTTGFQFEEGSRPSSYIKTEGAQVTRAADNVSRELGAEFNANEFTVVMRGVVSVGSANSAQRLLSLNDGTNAERLTITRTSLITSLAGSSIVTGRSNIPDEADIAVSWDSITLTIYINGVEWFSGERDINPVLFSQIQIGKDPQSGIRGATFSSVNILPRALSESELQALTTPEA